MTEFTMNDSLQETITGFDAVWRRVKGGAAAPSEDESLCLLIRGEQCSAVYDACLARMFQGTARSLLQTHANNASARARRLGAEYFIRTGLCSTPEEECHPCGRRLIALRTAMEKDSAAAEAYRAAARDTSCAELEAIYQRFAEARCAAAQDKRGIILRCF